MDVNVMASEEVISITADEDQLNLPMSYESYEYDVFLCFRGLDTRHTFAATLHNALRCNRFKTFMDDGGFKMGDKISLLKYQGFQLLCSPKNLQLPFIVLRNWPRYWSVKRQKINT
ncbi:unnamed protein product [Trifolium pratense]|uniref:Uncharacterized protein n=1 Tax=Trifolium pratense TaxID=57577 RepID=A0ACB0IQ11_TRIPR|nr:unnamed protein product [Trifolium pratense]